MVIVELVHASQGLDSPREGPFFPPRAFELDCRLRPRQDSQIRREASSSCAVARLGLQVGVDEQAIVVVQGSQPLALWQERLAPHRVVQRELDRCGWILRGGETWCIDASGRVQVRALLWRVGAVQPTLRQREVLALLRFAGVPCVNSAKALLAGFDRLEMLAELRELGLPMLDCDVALGLGALATIAREPPFVVKVGNFHGGFGKLRVDERERWSEYVDLIATADTYVATEPFVEYIRDVRCLQIGNQHWAIERRGRGWRANVDTIGVRPIEPPAELVEWTQRVAEARGLDMLGLDALETESGWKVLEVNDVPGLRGFPDAALDAVAQCVLARL